jgi:hypothetical protein
MKKNCSACAPRVTRSKASSEKSEAIKNLKQEALKAITSEAAAADSSGLAVAHSSKCPVKR